ncbi:cytoplasmic dynein 1 light intermediate chain 2 isoform X3 [Strongylocentrotus purpuratus]|uniref:Dynein light intermediate chain n=1 Tax=Strongylocentrotus purpuratus TaxID=7668 RepID=A0A7M7HKN7_STRPU|nr:cytoplasmic dynein 1 light intermediate chain 2 isoform X3 [Strongylocentrotus purpuratus]|eukprot:XP_011676218.1 PREDICTED: cytoplasmic dynein 1 light intermediate chain 2 isoform X3 [Strongylocentrotus purpuratus]
MRLHSSNMAPIGEKSAKASSAEKENDDDEPQNLWTSILSEVSSHSSSKLPSCKSILVLGEDETGKTTLLSRLQGVEDPKKGYGLEYLYLDVRDEDRDDTTRCGVWILAGENEHEDLLRYALTADNLEHMLVIIAVDMCRPWNIMDSLQKWTQVIRRHVDSLRIPPEKLRELEQRLVQQFQAYTEPETGQDSSVTRRTSGVTKPTGAEDEEAVVLPLGETTLTHNLGVPIVVVVTKSDYVNTLEKEQDYSDEHLDFLQQNVRKFCLNYGAALFYVSVKENKNCDLLNRYLLHRLYDFPFNSAALVVEKDALFVPSGWDNLQKVSILYENMANIDPEKPYDEVIIKPVVRRLLQDNKEIIAEDEQVFLMKQQATIRNAAQGKPGEASPRAADPRAMRTPEKRNPTNAPAASPITTQGKPKQIDPGKPGSANEGVLANFFNSLLSKKSVNSPAPGSPRTGNGGEKAVRNDAAAELDRMTRGRKPVAGTAPSSDVS